MRQSLGQAAFKHLLKLASDPQYRHETNSLLIYGHHIVNEHAKRHSLDFLAVTEEYLRRHPAARMLPIDTKLSQEQLTRITKEPKPEGILASIKKPTTRPFNPVARRSLLLFGPFRHPENVGALVRTAVAFGWDQVLLSKGSVDKFHPACIKASRGAVLSGIPVIAVDLEATLIPKVETGQIQILLAEAGARSTDMPVICPDSRLVLVLGSESHGLAGIPLAFRNHGTVVSIPTQPAVPCLNVAAAGAILMHHYGP